MCFDLDKKKSGFISDGLCNKGGGWAWKRQPRQQGEIFEFQALKDEVLTSILSDSIDVWKSSMSGDGRFYVHDLRSLIDSFLMSEMYNVMTWISLVPLKITCFI